jgi:predicted HTH domain antitoxin
MSVLHIDLPPSLLASSGQSEEEFLKEAKFLLALKLFEVGRISSGRAAEVSGLPRLDFLLLAGKMGVPVVELDSEELGREFEDA